MAAPDAARWRALSPHLDALLDAEPSARAAQLATLRAQDPALAEELAALVAEHESLQAEGFLEAGALPPPAGLAGQTLGAYTLERQLGEGGMGQVWLARRTDGRYEGHVAIKLLRGGLRAGVERERFAEEGRILARLDHPHIARLLDAGVSAEGAPFLVIEHVDGEAIDRHIERLRLPLAQRVALLLDACDAVAHAHARLILHRDLKPSNVMVRADGQLKLLDFGIAKLLDRPADDSLTERVGAAYTPRYAAPEQRQGEEVTTATDVYALGVLLYELLGGGHPTAEDGASPLEQLRALVEREPRPLSEQLRRRAAGGDTARRRDARAARGDLDTVVARALAKRPSERYANAAELAADLRRWRAHEPVQARPAHWLYRSAKFARRHRVAVGAAAGVAAALLGGAGVALHEAREAQAQRREAEGLIEFMLGDLRRRLQPVGRLDVLDAVGTRALAYYAAQDPSALDADGLGRRSRALHLIGEIAERRGQLDEAARRFDSAAAATAELLARAPQDGQRLFDHAQSEYWVGFIARRRGDLGAAEAAMRRYGQLARQLEQVALATPGASAEWRAERPYAEQNLGVILLDAGRPREALAVLESAAAALQQLRTASAGAAESLPVTLGWLARARESSGDLPGALAAREASAAAAPAGSVPDSVAEYDRALALIEAAALRLAMGDSGAAVATADTALELLQGLAERDPSNLDWAGQLGLARLQRAQALAARGDLAAARRDVAEAGAALAPLWQTDPDKRYWHVKVRGLWLLARAALLPGEPAADELDRFVAAVSQAEAARGPLEGELSGVVAQVLLLRGDRIAERRGEPAAAERDWSGAAARLAARASAGDLTARALHAHARLRLGDAQAARQAAEKLASTPYRHPLLADLQRRLGTAGKAASGS